MKGEKYCYQHKKKLPSKYIFHGKPALKYNTISFSKKEKVVGKCQFKNKYDEYVCNCNCNIDNRFCESHFLDLKNLAKILKYLIVLLEDYKITGCTLDNYMKLYLNLYNYIITHKEKFVNFSMDEFIDNSLKKNDEFISCFISGNISNNLIRKKLKTSINEYIEILYELQNKFKLILVPIQIEQAKKELINTNININMLSEIYIKSENSNEKFPVFCKGIDKHILSYCC
jgi:hypothetical protein